MNTKRNNNFNLKNAKRKKTIRENESLHQREIRLEKNRLSMQKNRQNESKEAKELRLQKQRDSYTKKKQNETISQKQKILESKRIKKREWRANLFYQNKQVQAKNDRARKAVKQAKETSNNRKIRLNAEKMRKRKFRIIQSESDDKKSNTRCKNNLFQEGFTYNPLIDYSMNLKISIGEMSYTCKFCRALKFKNEPPGICCSKGKITLPCLLDPPEPLKSYVSNNSDVSKHFLKNGFKYNDIFKMTSFRASKLLNQGCYLPTFKIQGRTLIILYAIIEHFNKTHSQKIFCR